MRSLGSTTVHDAPGPRGVPLAGMMPAMLRDPLGMLERVAREFGPVARYRLATQTVFQLNDPDAIEHVFTHGRVWDKGSFQIETMRRVGGSGLFMAEGAAWLRRRRLMNPVFHHRRLPAFAAAMVHEIERTAAAWAAAGPGTVRDLRAEMMHLTLDVAAKTLFSSAVPGDVTVIDRAMRIIVEDLSFRFTVPLYPPLVVPTARNRRFVRSLDELERVVFAIIEDRRRVLEGGGEPPDDLLTMLMTATDAETGAALSQRELRDEVITLLLAGHETTALTLTWCWYLLARHPQERERLEAELTSVLAGRTPSFDDLPALRITRAVLDETLRLYPAAWITSRRAQEEDVVAGSAVPKGALAWMSPWVVHRSPEWWTDPERFDAGRFLGDPDPQRPRYAYFPFGGGGHQCIGRDFARMEAMLVLAVLASRFRLELVDAASVGTRVGATLGPDRPVLARVRAR